MSRPEINLEKETIISEYLKGGITFRALGKKTGVDFRTIHQWVRIFEGKVKKRKTKESSNTEADLPSDVKQLQELLRKEQLRNKLLNTMIDIAEEQLKIDIRKKPGTKR